MTIEARLSLHVRLLAAALATALAAAGLFWSGVARADDIDIYSLPNVEGDAAERADHARQHGQLERIDPDTALR